MKKRKKLRNNIIYALIGELIAITSFIIGVFFYDTFTIANCFAFLCLWTNLFLGVILDWVSYNNYFGNCGNCVHGRRSKRVSGELFCSKSKTIDEAMMGCGEWVLKPLNNYED